MKIQINAKTLNNILKKVKPFINFNLKKLPILQTIKITAFDTIQITATDLQNSIIVNIPGEIFEQGEICINHKEFQQIVKSQTEDIIITDTTIENGITINYESMSVLDYPNIRRVEDNQQSFTLSNDFITGLNTCLPHAWNRKLEGSERQIYEGIWIDSDNMIASDTHTLAVYKQNEIQYQKNILIPTDAVKCIINTFKKSNKLQCKVNNNLIEISDDTYTVICWIYTDLQIPKYKSIIQGLKGYNHITVDTKYFKSIIDKLPVKEKIIIDENDVEFNTMVDLEIMNNSINMNTLTVKPFEIECKEVYGDYLKLSYYNHLMKKLVNGFNEKEDKELTIKFNRVLTPFTIQNDKMMVLGLPVRK